MIVDDEVLLAAEMRHHLRQAGYQVTSVVSSGESAIHQAAADLPDIVLMDVRMPGPFDGIEAARQIQANHNIPVIYLTAHADSMSVTRAKGTSPFGFLLKPVRRKDLQIAIDMALEKHRLEEDLRRTNERLERSETRFRELFQHMSSGVAVYEALDNGADFVFTDFNKAGERIDQISREDLLGRRVSEVFPAVREAGLFQALRRVWHTGEPESVPVALYRDARINAWRKNFVYKLPSGELVSVYDDVTQQKMAEDELRRYREHLEELVEARTEELQRANRQLAHEIDERRRTEAALREAKVQADAANQAKSEFLANMSHDIRTPMNAIMGFAEILKDQVRHDPQQRGYLDRILGSSRNLLRLMNDILDLSKIEAGYLDIRPESVDLYSLVHDVKQAFVLQAHEKGITLTTTLAPAVPQYVRIDAGRLTQVFMNLVGNAVKFTEHGGVQVSVTATPGSPDGRDVPETGAPHAAAACELIIDISDTGIGIESHEIERIFDPFHQAESHERRFGGTGLGLAIARRLVRMMKGDITLDSAPGAGTHFRMTLPDIAVVEDGPETAARPSPKRRALRFEPATVLIAEDNAANREVLRTYLAPYPFHLLEAVNGQEAVDLATSVGLDVIVMDIHMPVLDGYEAALAIRAAGCAESCAMVALTAYAMPTQRQQYQDAFDAYISKPVSSDALLSVLAQFLPHSEASAETVPDDVPESPRDDAWEADLAHLSPVSADALREMRATLLPYYQTVNDVLSIDEVLEFTRLAAAFGERWSLPPFSAYAQELQCAGQMFDIQRIKALLDRFQAMLDAVGA